MAVIGVMPKEEGESREDPPISMIGVLVGCGMRPPTSMMGVFVGGGMLYSCIGVFGCESVTDGGEWSCRWAGRGGGRPLRSGAIEVASESIVDSVFCVRIDAGCELVLVDIVLRYPLLGVVLRSSSGKAPGILEISD